MYSKLNTLAVLILRMQIRLSFPHLNATIVFGSIYSILQSHGSQSPSQLNKNIYSTLAWKTLLAKQ
jgi:hypothetical protein